MGLTAELSSKNRSHKDHGSRDQGRGAHGGNDGAHDVSEGAYGGDKACDGNGGAYYGVTGFMARMVELMMKKIHLAIILH